MTLPLSAKIEIAAKAMHHNRFGERKGAWEWFIWTHPDIAEIYRENARVALQAIEQAEGASPEMGEVLQ
jgi:hypothetical protein